MTFTIIKMHGCENDFFFLNKKECPNADMEFYQKLAINLCNRHTGLGADGLIIWEWSDKLSALIINSDGSLAATCGNALRCLAYLCMCLKLWSGTTPIAVHRLTGIDFTQADAYLNNLNPFATIYNATQLPNEASATVTVGMGNATLVDISNAIRIQNILRTKFPSFTFADLQAVFVQLANPHWVFISSAFATFDMALLEQFGLFAQQQLRLQLSPLREISNIGMLYPNNTSPFTFNLHVFERGAGLTRACGSGATAARIALEEIKLANINDAEINFNLLGGILTIKTLITNQGTERLLVGNATYIATCMY